ncbi:MAG: branched-chain amino acid ABC transporter permease [Alicyclobacillus sp.]|nr:branched-chain amino acid ABC transporter permease [Alicyclobacillus sp.]
MSVVVVQSLLGGVLLGLMYGLVGVGLTFSMGFGKMMNVAHGTLIILGAFLTMVLFVRAHVNIWWIILIIAVLFGLLGSVLDRVLFRYLEHKGEVISLLVLFGLAEIVENVTSWIWTGNVQALTVPALQRGAQMGAITLPFANLFTACLAVAVGIGLYAALRFTYIGRAIRAYAQSVQHVRLLGIDAGIIRAVIFVTGVVLAGLAGMAVGVTFPFSPQDQNQWLILAFIVAVIGGVDGVLSTLLAGLVVGVVQAAAGLVVPFQDENLILYGFLALALIVRNGHMLRKTRLL